MRKFIFLLITLLIVNNISAKTDILFTASAPDVVVVGDQFRLSYTITTQKVKDFRAPGNISGFDILMGPTRSMQSNRQFINGNVTSTNSITYTYILLATKEGEFAIPAATVNANGEQMISNSLKIKVLPTDKSSNDTSGKANRTSSSSQPSSNTTVSNQDLFATVTATRTNVFEQEAFLLTYKIYTLVNLQFESVKLPDFKGFHSQEVELPRNTSWKLEHYNGRNYNAVVYRQFVLFPQQAGQIVIEPARFDASVVKPVRVDDPFDAFFNGGSNYVEIKKTITTPKLTINVATLPVGKPLGFSGGVGEFNLSSSINKQELKTNDAITIKLVISGTGNLKLISNPEIEFPSDFETFDPKVDNNTKLTKDGLTGSRTIEYLAIPRHAGKYKIPSAKFSYFDVKSKSYKTLTTEEYEINVLKGEGNADQVIANFTNKEELKILGEDIRFIKLNTVNLQPKGHFFFGSLLYWMFYIIPSLIFIVLFFLNRKQVIENRNVAKARTKKANRVAVKRLKLAGKLLLKKEEDAFYDEVLKALWGYISDKLNIPVSKLSKDNIEEKLINYGVSEDLIKEFINALNECEFARFAPGDGNQAMDKVYTSALEIISKIENSIKS